MSAVITLTTDFGLADGYVAAMKGVIFSINPEARLVDICHNIKPQSIGEAAFILSTVHQFFPQGTIHVVVVDPGVGTERRAIILRTPSADFVAPDNGVLSYVIQQSMPSIKGRLKGRSPFKNYSSPSPSKERGNEGVRLIDDQHQIELLPDLKAVAITKPDFWRSPVSSTFHGRDIFAPVAAHLSLGMSLMDFGEAVTSVTVFPLSYPYQSPDGTLIGHILHIDNFGNLITDINSEHLSPLKQPVTIEVGSQRIAGLSRTYAESSGLLALIGSSGYLEVSLSRGNASTFLNAEVGDEVRIR